MWQITFAKSNRRSVKLQALTKIGYKIQHVLYMSSLLNSQRHNYRVSMYVMNLTYFKLCTLLWYYYSDVRIKVWDVSTVCTVCVWYNLISPLHSWMGRFHHVFHGWRTPGSAPGGCGPHWGTCLPARWSESWRPPGTQITTGSELVQQVE